MQSIFDVFKRLSLINPVIILSSARVIRMVVVNPLLIILLNHLILIIQLHAPSNNNNDNNKYSFRVSQVLGREISQNLLPISLSNEDLSIEGFISLPTFSRSNSLQQYFFVNGRPVWDKNLTTAVRVSYSDFIMKGRYPITVIFINCPD